MENKKILIIEDEPLLGNLLKQRLEKEGFLISLAKNGEEGLDFLKKEKFDLVLLDIILPKISGFELMDDIKKNPEINQAPIVVVSNLGQDQDILKGQNLGAVNYFIKAQITIEELVEYINNFFKK